MKKYIVLLASVFVIAIAGIAGISAVNSSNSQQYFASSGYVLSADTSEKITFTEQTAYSASTTGTVQFQNAEGSSTSMSEDAFVHLDDGSVMALSDGVLLDFNDLSSNFINNYYTTRTLSISESGGSYVAETESGTITFGEHLWKLSDDKYIIRSSSLTVHFSDSDVRDAGDYVEVYITADGIVQIMTEDDVWMTISESCYIETAGGVTINPVTKIIEDGTYQITINKLVVSADDSIVLTEDETRRQIVPEINIEAIDGEDGESGVSGEDGISGNEGEDGTAGTDGEEGSIGGDGDSGSSGSNGAKGIDAVTDSSTNTAIPTMSISDWQVTSTSLQATLYISGGYETLEITTIGKDYFGLITITDALTGEVVYGYQADAGYLPSDSTDWQITDFHDCPEYFYFTTATFNTSEEFSSIDSLSPDTQYLLSVSGYYEINGNVYYREFISRTFYTDSTGVQFVYSDATTSSVGVSYTQTQDGETTLYLLTAAQNETFSLAASDSASSYTASVKVTKDSIVWFTQDNDDNALSSDTTYYVRAIITDAKGTTSLSGQVLEISTLKETPVWDADAKPTAYYNRVNGAYEVYRPTVQDADDGVEYYVYTAYDVDGNELSSKKVYPSDAEPITFYLASGSYYYFGVEMYFNDNEKVTIYDLGLSDAIMTTGSSLPKITWQDLDCEYDALKGVIYIELDGSSKIDTSSLIYLQVYADQVLDTTYTMSVAGQAATVGTVQYKNITYSVTNTNTILINIELDNLYKNTNYTFTVSGSIDFEGTGEEEDYITTTLGFVSAQTYDMPTVAVQSSVPTGNTAAIAQAVTLSAVASTTGGSTTSYVEQQLEVGKVVVYLYSGTGSSKVLLGWQEYTAANDVAAFYEKTDTNEDGVVGMLITESSFGLSNLSSGQNYTIVISEVYDDTYSMNLGYVNAVTNISGASIIVTAVATPPDLSSTPNSQVKVTEIYNIDATSYGAIYDPDMPDDTVIGYKVQSNYDNSQRLAKTVTYYLYEYSEFYATVQNYGLDPIENADALKTITLDTPNSEDTVPAIALFFDDVTFSSGVTTDGTTTMQSCAIYQGETGETITRGYCYIFAYTVEYSVSDNAVTSTYPNTHSDYTSYMNTYGCGLEEQLRIGTGKAYVLTSGLIEAPKTEPEFYSYVYDVEENTATIHFTFDDSDGAIVTTDGEDKTQLYFTNEDGVYEIQDIDKDMLAAAATGEKQWYQLVMTYDIKNTNLLQPQVLIDDYVVDYGTIFNALWGGSYVEEPFYLAQIPVEDVAAFDSLVEKNVKITMNTDYIENNYIIFTLSDMNAGSTAVLDTLEERSYALKLVFSDGNASDDENIDAKTFYMPITTTTISSTVTFSTAQISEFLGTKFTVTASLYYDNGLQGWSLLEYDTDSSSQTETSDFFALQRINSVENGEIAGFAHGIYYVYSKGSSYLPSGGLMTSSVVNDDAFLSNLRATVLAESTIYTTFSYMSGNTSLNRYLSVQQFGVADSTNSSYDNFANYYMVPKGVSVYQLYFEGGQLSETTTLSTITPTVGTITKDVSVNMVKFSEFIVDGYDEILADDDGNRYVTVSVYSNQESAEDLSTENLIERVTVALDGNGVYGLSTSEYFEVGGLTSDTVYYYVFSADVGENATTAKTMILLDTDSATEIALYSFETIDGIRITPSTAGVLYYNLSYQEKTLELDYTLNETLDITVVYDIYSASDVTTSSGEYVLEYDATLGEEEPTPVLAYLAMKDASMITASAASSNNTVVVDLTPATSRAALVPGATYYLRVKASTSDGSVTSEVLRPFTIDSVGNISALIYVNDKTSHSITYKITIVDPQYSLMNITDTDNAGPYVIRFTDENGNRIYTSYDDDIFYASDYQQEIVLDNNTIKPNTNAEGYQEMVAGESYTLTVYSLVDLEHDGLSYPVAIGETSGQSVDYFYGGTSTWGGLNSLVNSFWGTSGDTNRQNITVMDDIESKFSIASKAQETTGESNLALSDTYTVKLNTSSCLTFTLSESYGIIDENGDQAFDEIVYSIEGMTSSSSSIYTGTSTGELFVEGENLIGLKTYTYTIPQTVSSTGYYYVTIQLYKDGSIYKTYSFTYGG